MRKWARVHHSGRWKYSDSETARLSPLQAKGAAAEDRIPADTVFDLLAHNRRRLLLRHLDAHEFMVPIEDVAAGIAAEENETGGETVSDEQRKPILTSLVHKHLPRLTEAGVVEYDRKSRMVAPTEKMGQLVEHLTLMDSR